jgi:restriction system protein
MTRDADLPAMSSNPSLTPAVIARQGLLPWSAGLLLAIGAYLLLHDLAASAPTAKLAGWAETGQYALPAVLVVLAAIWGVRRGRQGAGSIGGTLGRLKPDEIRALLRDSFQSQGYQVVDKAPGAADGRVDLVLRRGHETFLVWAKTWADTRVGIEPVQKLCRAMDQRSAGGGFIVTTGRFGRDASIYAAGHNVRLIDGAALRDLRVFQPRAKRP